MRLCVLLAMAGMLLLLCGCGDYGYPKDKLKWMEGYTGLNFPTNAVVVHFIETSPPIDPTYAVKMTIPSDSLDKLIEAIKAKRRVYITDGGRPSDVPYSDNVDWLGMSGWTMPSDSVVWWKIGESILDQYYWGTETRNVLVHVIVAQETDGGIALYFEIIVT